MVVENTYHEGEKKIQELVGEQRTAESNGRVITKEIIKGAINFIEKQPMAVVSSADQQSTIWTSLLIGDAGFISVPTPRTIVFKRDLIYSDNNDRFFENVFANPNIGILFIELNSRRRFRVNGKVSSSGNLISVDVCEAYPNCPKYIQQRILENPQGFTKTSTSKISGNLLTPPIKTWIRSSDTFFVGSQSNQQNMDASHRGGNPGFVEIMDDRTLKIPDYAGNSMYNTLGNFMQNPNAGLLFIDFDNRKILQLTGSTEIILGQTGHNDLIRTGNTGRYWIFRLSEWTITENHHNVNWELLGFSPFNPSL